jgi:hypothetical protein
MKNLLRFFVACMLLSATSYAGNYTWTGTTNTSWNTNTNWNPNGIPGSSDTITINTTTTSLVLTGKQTIKRLVMTNDTLNLGGDTLEITGSAGFNGGHIINGVCYPQATGLLSFAGTTFGAEVKAKGQIKLNGCTFNSTAYFEHIGSAAGTGAGGNTFNGTTTLKNAGTSTFRLAGSSNDTFNGDVTVISAATSGSGSMQLSAGGSSYFNGNIVVNSTTVFGISFSSAGAGSSVLASGKTISIGGSGFVGTLLMRNFTQLGTTAQTLSFNGILNIMNSEFNGSLTSSSTNLLLTGNNFHGVCSFTKTGTSSDYSAGGNHFYQNLTIQNNVTNTSIIRMASTNGDIYEGDVTLNTNSGYIQMAYADTSDFYGDITINNSKVNFNSGVGVLHIAGTSTQSFLGTAGYTIAKLIVNNTSNGTISCNQPITIDSVLVLTQGILTTDSTNILTLKASAVCNTGSSFSFVDGPMKKIGNTAFVFPVGDGDVFKELTIAGGSLITDAYVCEFFNRSFGSLVHDTSILEVNGCLFWSLERKVGTGSPQVKIDWSSNDCYITNPSTMRIATFDGNTWKNMGYVQSTGTSLSGSVTGVNGNWYRYLTFANILDTTAIAHQFLLKEVALFSLLDSISPPGNLKVTGKAVSLWNGNVSSLGAVSISDSIFADYSTEYINILEPLTGKNFGGQTIQDGDTISGGGYFTLIDDSLNQGLYIVGDSTDKVFIKGVQRLVFGSSASIQLQGINRENVVWVLNDLKLDSNSCMFGVVFSNNVELTHEHIGTIQLFAKNHLLVSRPETFNNVIYLKSLNNINENLRHDFTDVNQQSLPCNKILNGDVELGVVPINVGGVQSGNANNWDATGWQFSGLCTSASGGNNSPDLFDKTLFSSFIACNSGQNGGYGIPINFASNGVVDVRLPGSSRYIHTLDKETANVRISANSLQPKLYILEFYHAFSNCNTPSMGSVVPSCIGFLPNATTPTVVPDILASPNLSTMDWQGNPVPTGTWLQDLVCIDLTGYTNTINNFNRIGIKAELQGSQVFRDVFFDDFQLVQVSDAGEDYNICQGGNVILGDLDNCLSILSGVQISYSWSANPPYNWSVGQDILPNPLVSPLVTTTFTLTTTITFPDGATSCIDSDDMTVNVSNVSGPTVNFNLSSPYSLCQGQSVNVCASSLFSSYNWSTSATTQCISINTGGTYSLTVTDQNGCTGSNNFLVNIIPCCSLSIALSPQVPCAPATTSSINVQLNNGTGPYVINWQQTVGGTASGSFTTSATSFSLPGLLTGTYSVSVTDANNCTASSSATIFISANPSPPQIVGTNSICNFANGLSYTISNAMSGVVYSWSILPGFSAPGATATFNPSSGSSTTATFSTNTNYMVNVVATNTYGCTSSSQLPINACCTSSEATIVDGSSSTLNQSLMFFTIEGVFQVNTNTVWNGKDIKMGAGAQITIQPFKTLTIINTTITACDYFWKSINVSPYAQIIVDNSIIQGGQYAIDVNSRGAYTLQNNTRLFDNYISLRVSGSSSNLPRTITGTSIRKAPGTTSKYNSLLDYINQTPATGNTTTCNARPHTGIHLDLVGVNTIGSSLPGTSNYIADAVYGIRSINSWARVVHTVIENIQVDNCQTNNPEEGSGIYATTIYPTGNLWAWDNNAGVGYGVEIKNCITGIRTDNLGPIIKNGVITQVQDGIRATDLPSSLTGDKFELFESEVEYRDRGVRIGGTAVRDIGAGVHKSELTDYNAGIISNNVNGGVIVSIPKVAGSYLVVSENTFENTFTPRGVFAAGLADLNVGHNSFDLNSLSFQNGITASSSDDLYIGQNTIEGLTGTLPWARYGITLRNTGIVNAPANQLYCNEVTNCDRNIWFDNVNSNMIMGNNAMSGGRNGLFLISAVLGNQIDQYNKWCGPFVNDAINADAQSNVLFRVPTTAIPPPPFANCDYNPLNSGTITGQGIVTILQGGNTSDPGCPNLPPAADTINITDYDRFIVDSLPGYNLGYATNYHHYRMLAGKLAAHPELISQDPVMENFMEIYRDSQVVAIANFEQQTRTLLTHHAGYFDQAKIESAVLASHLTEIAALDSMLMEDGAGNDSLLLSRRFELSEMMDSLVSQIDSFMTLGYSQIAEYANTLRDEIAAYDFTLPQAKTEKDYLLFFLKYGQWSTDTLTQEDSTLLSDIAHLCAYEYGSVVYWARNIYMEWYEEELDDAEICGTGSRMASAISPKESSLQVKLIPNPASKEVVLQLEGDAIEYSHTQVGIFHITGEQLFSQEFTGKSTTLALETFPAGSYLVKVILQEGEVLYKKLLVIK